MGEMAEGLPECSGADAYAVNKAIFDVRFSFHPPPKPLLLHPSLLPPRRAPRHAAAPEDAQL